MGLGESSYLGLGLRVLQGVIQGFGSPNTQILGFSYQETFSFETVFGHNEALSFAHLGSSGCRADAWESYVVPSLAVMVFGV